MWCCTMASFYRICATGSGSGLQLRRFDLDVGGAWTGRAFVSVQSQRPFIVNPVLGQLRHRITDLDSSHDGGVQ
jgi:hypothetical protein